MIFNNPSIPALLRVVIDSEYEYDHSKGYRVIALDASGEAKCLEVPTEFVNVKKKRVQCEAISHGEFYWVKVSHTYNNSIFAVHKSDVILEKSRGKKKDGNRDNLHRREEHP